MSFEVLKGSARPKALGKNDEFCIKNEDLCIKNEDFVYKMMNFAAAVSSPTLVIEGTLKYGGRDLIVMHRAAEISRNQQKSAETSRNQRKSGQFSMEES